MFTNRIKIKLKTKDRVILHQRSNMLYGGMLNQFSRMDKKRRSLFHTKDLSDRYSALWGKEEYKWYY